MTIYVQRQFAGWLAAGSDTDPVTYAPSSRVWDLRDGYPSNILKLADGQQCSAEIILGASASQALTLPYQYSSANRLCVVIKTTSTLLKVTTTVPVLGSSVFSVKAGASSDELAFATFTSRVSAITILNSGATSSTTRVFMFEVPDLSDTDSWRDGYQTTGVVTA